MIKFFRNIRQSLVMENKTSKYLKYAIGEIILVVIGILIALQINNWNESRQNEAKITNILEDIQKDLSDDVLDANRVFNRYIVNDSLQKLFLDGKLSPNRYRYIYFYANFIIHKNGYLNLTQNSNSIPNKYVDIYKELNNLYINIASDIPVYNDRIRATVYNNLDYIAKSKPWFIEWNQGKITPEMEQFYTTDISYINQSGLYMIDLSNLTNDTNRFKIKAIDMYKKIDSLLGHKNPIPEQMTYCLADTTQLKHLEGHYVWQEGLEYDKNETVVFKVKNGALYSGYQSQMESEYFELYWYKDLTFFSDILRVRFSTENGKTILSVIEPNGYQKWVRE